MGDAEGTVIELLHPAREMTQPSFWTVWYGLEHSRQTVWVYPDNKSRLALTYNCDELEYMKISVLVKAVEQPDSYNTH